MTANVPIDNDDIESVVRRIEEELVLTKDRLRSAIEQYDLSVKGLDTSNEQLLKVKNDLRSASQGFEIEKLEMQAENDRSTAIDHELKEKADIAEQVNSNFQDLLSSADIGSIFLDRALQIRRYTPVIEDIFNIIPTDIGRPLSHLTHKLEQVNCTADAAEVLRTLKLIEREVRDRDGKAYMIRTLPYRTADGKVEGVVLTFTDIGKILEAKRSRLRLSAIVDNSNDAIISFSEKNHILSWNPAAERIFGYTAQEAIGRSIDILASKDKYRDHSEMLDRVWNGDSINELRTVYVKKRWCVCQCFDSRVCGCRYRRGIDRSNCHCA